MALQTINVGNFVNDGTGDDLRTAFVKVNENFDELDLRGGQANTISNLGNGVGIFKEKVGVDLRLKSLVAGSNIAISSNANTITISSTGGGALVTETNPTLSANLNLNNNDLINGRNITAVDFYGRFNGPSIGVHNGPVSGNVTGNLIGLVHGIDIRDLNNVINSFDFGNITDTATTFLEYLFLTTTIDMGSFTSPNTITIESGPLV